MSCRFSRRGALFDRRECLLGGETLAFDRSRKSRGSFSRARGEALKVGGCFQFLVGLPLPSVSPRTRPSSRFSCLPMVRRLVFASSRPLSKRSIAHVLTVPSLVSGVGAVNSIPFAILPGGVASPDRTVRVGVRTGGRVLHQWASRPTRLAVAASDGVAVRPPVVRHVPHVLGRCSVEAASASEPFYSTR